jgi:3alpha(or 20beta)-hydroxysteroid dehydrogenase
MQDFASKTVVITGAAGGQGAEEARLFAQHGAHVVVADLNADKGKELVEELGKADLSAEFISLDVASASDWAELRTRLESRGEGLDVLINNAGTAHRFGLMETSLERFNEVLAINLTGPFLGMQALAPLMRDSGGGSIINIGSAAGMTGHFSAAYSSSKWGLRGLSMVAAMEFAPWKIRVNSIHPGIVNTALVPGDTSFPEAMTKFTPMGRAAEPSDIAPVALFLAGDGSGFMTGTDLNVDGGLVDIGVYDAIAKEYARS